VFPTDQALLRTAVEARRAAAAAQARELEALAEYARRHEQEEFAHLEVAPLLHISDRAAFGRLQFARVMTEELTKTFALVQRGELEEFKAQLIAGAVRYLGEDESETVETQVLPLAAEQTPGQLKAALAKAVMAADPVGAELRRQERQAYRRVCSQPAGDGEAVLSIYHSPAKIALMRAAIRGRAMRLKRAGDEPRTLAQLEADVAADLIMGSDEHVHIEAHFVLPLDPTQPAEVETTGPITRREAWDLVQEAQTWRWLRTDPETGVVVDLTAPSYRPPAALAEFVKLRDRTCRHPGCIRPARTCDLDHRVPWPKGETSSGNLDAGCRRHHRAKTLAGWQVEKLQPGFLQWKSPLGFLHRVRPQPVTIPTVDPPPF
jgi:Domain of unknown function (DUF222)